MYLIFFFLKKKSCTCLEVVTEEHREHTSVNQVLPYVMHTCNTKETLMPFVCYARS